MMSFGRPFITLVSIAASTLFLLQSGKAQAQRPNIIVILADDLGYGDLGGSYGGKARTPNLDRLASEGMRFTDFHSNGPMCSPTRAAFLTGRYQQRLGIERALPTDWSDRGIGTDKNTAEITVAEYLKRVGYTTAIFGKWHLGKHASANPVHHGFDEFRGQTCGCGDYFAKLDRNGYRDWWHNDVLSFQEGYATDVISDNAVDFIGGHKDKPFFLYVAYTAIHFPWQSAEDYDLQTRRVGGDFTSPSPGTQSKLGPHTPGEVPDVVVRMIEEMDAGIGRIITALKLQGLDQNTLVIFTSDNGGYWDYHQKEWPAVSSNGVLRGQKGQVYEGGHRVPGMAWWPGHIAPGSLSEETVMTFDLLPTFLDLLDLPLPPENSRNALDGRSILPILLRNERLPVRPLFWRIGEQKAVRKGQWKMVIAGTDREAELYDLSKDMSERSDVSSTFPSKVTELRSQLATWEASLTDSGE